MLVLLALVASAVISSAHPAERRQVGQVITSCSVPGTAALTFDDGPYIYLNQIVDTLDANNATGTFFFNGNNFDCIYDLDASARVQYAYSHGHQVASHTWSHPDLATLDAAEIDNQFFLLQQAIQRLTGAVPAFMRPPFGSYNDLVLQEAGNFGLIVTLWDLELSLLFSDHSGDATGASVQQSESIYEAVISQNPPSILTLNHETVASTASDLLPFAITSLRNAGYNLVSVADCLGVAPYQSVGAPGVRDAALA
ncbi:carbohydrate esterase family 4 protein [Amanita thiersii Skay4041]|uniref:Carbohydrate esterase family 4 protein n=1 Tax=Amanita thiersii Skay4041 TaxID=703135 RepID=A0A2A9NKP9_9AGAR|nr:carbohydrate esterase family 4 protein [Amanita thiersii Skay4041]